MKAWQNLTWVQRMNNEEELEQSLDEQGGGFEELDDVLDYAKDKARDKASDTLHKGLDELRYKGREKEAFDNSTDTAGVIDRDPSGSMQEGKDFDNFSPDGGSPAGGAGDAPGASPKLEGGAGDMAGSGAGAGGAAEAGEAAASAAGGAATEAGAGAASAGAGAAGSGAAGAASAAGGAASAGAGAAASGAAGAAEAGAAAASTAGSAIGTALAGAGEAVAATLPWSALIVLALVVLIGAGVYINNKFGGLMDIRDAVMSRVRWFVESAEDVMGGLKDIVADALDFARYEEEPSNLWNGVDDPEHPEDVNRTMLVLNAFKEYEGQGDVETSDDPDKLGTTEETFWQQLMNKENLYLTQENMTDVLQRCVDYNNEMFRYFKQYYEYLQWELKIKKSVITGQPVGKYWERTYPVTDTSSDGLFELESRIHIEGEKDKISGKRKFAINWQDVMALAMILSQGKTTEERKEGGIVYSDSSFHKVEEIDPEAWVYDDEIKDVFDLFRYKFDYFYGTDEELKEHSTRIGRFDYDGKPPVTYKSLAKGEYQLGYRYKRIADPQPQDNLPLSYSFYGEAPYTKFVPEQAPNLISNSYEAYKYIYLDIDDVPDYTPDPDVYEPPDGMYCIGRWHILNPKHFIEAVDTMEPYWRNRSLGENGKKRKEYENYEWSRMLMMEYAEMLDVLPYTDEVTQGGQSRGQFFRELGDLYAKKKIVVSYEGTAYEGMDEFVNELESQYEGWHVIWDKDNEAELKAGLKENLRKNSDTGKIEPVGGSDTEGGEGELSDEELSNVAGDVMNLAKILYLEAGNQPYEGKVAVATVIMNRVKSSSFPDSIMGVISQSGQFEPYGSGKFNKTSDSTVPSECINIAYNVLYNGLTMKGWPDDVIGFQNPNIPGREDPTPDYHGSWPLYAIIGDHYFYSKENHGSGHGDETSNDGDDYEKIVSDDARSGGSGDGGIMRSNITGEFYPPFASDPGETYPFWSYGVTFHSLRGYGDNFLHISDEEFEHMSDWVIDYEGTRLRDEDEMIPDGLGTDVVKLANFMAWYLNQTTSGFGNDIRGASGEKYSESGCLDCTVAMILSYWCNRQILPTSFSNCVGSDGNLQVPSVLRKYGLKQSGNIAGNFSNGVKSEIDAGRPVIVHIKGHWGEYHTSGHGHFLCIYGYDKDGFYVADPGKSKNDHIPYKDWASVKELYYRTVTK